MTKDYSPVAHLTLNDIENVYVGKADKCMCGCSGTYSTDPAKVQRVLKKMHRHYLASGSVNCQDGYIYYTTIGKTQYTIYTTK